MSTTFFLNLGIKNVLFKIFNIFCEEKICNEQKMFHKTIFEIIMRHSPKKSQRKTDASGFFRE